MSALSPALAAIDRILLGKSAQVRLALACLLARGHLLIEDVPGVGKTTLARSLACVLGLEWRRVQFTSDLLPSDIVGVSVFHGTTQQFEFRPGPIFTQLLLADEVNRASPKAQSALLEAMEERQVSVDGQTRLLPAPFFVVATQNPHEHIGTYGLPESQLDRFLMRIHLGYPDAAHERQLLQFGERRDTLASLKPALSGAAVLALQGEARRVHVSAAILDYIQALVAYSRTRLAVGLSPRAAQGLLHAAQAYALVSDAPALLPEHVQAVLPAVATHRLEREWVSGGGASRALADELIAAVAVPV